MNYSQRWEKNTALPGTRVYLTVVDDLIEPAVQDAVLPTNYFALTVLRLPPGPLCPGSLSFYHPYGTFTGS